jgi:M3 family oligoendopeptidase
MKALRAVGLVLAVLMMLAACTPPAEYLQRITTATTPEATTVVTPAATTDAPAATQETTAAAPTTPATVEALAPTSTELSRWTQLLYASDTSITRDASGRALLDFSDMTYARPDLDQIDALFEELEQLIDQADDSQRVLEVYDEAVVAYGRAATAYTLVSIQSDLNVNDAAASEDKVLLEGKLNEYYELLGRLSKAILESPTLSEPAVALWGDNYAQDALFESTLTSQAVQDSIKEVSKLTDEYQQLTVNHTVTVEDEELTIDELMERTDLGMEYYTYLTEYYRTLNEQAGALFLRMVELRNGIARELGFEDYAQYVYQSFRRDYTPQESEQLAQAAKKYLVPLYRQLGQRMPESAYQGASVVMDTAESLDWAKELIPSFSADMGAALNFMLDHNLYNFDGGADKMTGGYTTSLDLYGVPFINIKDDGSDMLSTVFHEFGHFYNSYTFEDGLWNQTTDLDLAEIHSQGLELLLIDKYPEIYGSDELAQAVASYRLYSNISTILSGIMEDEFQRKLYAESDLTLEKLNAIYEDLLEEYHLYDSYFIPNSFWALTWVGIPHTFQVPFYYISYATSLISAMELWKIAQNDPDEALEKYLTLQRYSTTEPFQATLASVGGLASPFEESTIRDLTLMLDTYFAAAWPLEDEDAPDR